MKIVRRFLIHWQNRVGLFMVLAFVGIALAAPLISPELEKDPGPFQHDTRFRPSDNSPKSPQLAPPLGTLPGRISVFHALVWGTRNALQFGLLVVLSTATFGIFYGAVAGYFGGWLNRLLMRVADAFLAVPVIAAVALLNQLWRITLENAGGFLFNGIWAIEPGNSQDAIRILLGVIDPLALSLILFSWMPYARLTNAMVMTLKETDFIQAERALGAGAGQIIARHLIPNSLSPAVVLAGRDVGSMVILQASFTFIGLAGGSVWGEMLVIGRNWIIGPGGNLLYFWWTFIPATLALVLFGVGWNLFGDGINDLLDPHSY